MISMRVGSAAGHGRDQGDFIGVREARLPANVLLVARQPHAAAKPRKSRIRSDEFLPKTVSVHFASGHFGFGLASHVFQMSKE